MNTRRILPRLLKQVVTWTLIPAFLFTTLNGPLFVTLLADPPPTFLLEAKHLPDGQIELSWNQPNLQVESAPSLQPPITWNAVKQVPEQVDDTYRLQFPADSGQQYFRLARNVAANQSPVLNPIPDATVFSGITYQVTLQASDPDGDPLTFGLLPLPLPSGASLNASSGLFKFTPSETQVGSYSWTLSVSDGLSQDFQTFNLEVLPPPIDGVTSLAGIVLDTTDATQGTERPIVGVIVSLLGSEISAVTGSDGRFLLEGIPAGKQILDLATESASPAPDGSFYAGFREEIQVTENVANLITRPLYLPRLAMDSITPVIPNATTMVVNPTLGIELEIPPETAEKEGDLFEGSISISEVPLALAPAALPPDLQPSLLITIQPVGVVFNTPVALTFPNRDQLPPGSQLDLWSLDAGTGQFVVVGTGRVTADGTAIETIEGGVRAADWHMFLPPGSSGAGDGDGDCAECCPIDQDFGSSVNIHNGSLSTGFSLPNYFSQGVERELSFIYKSSRAYVHPVVPFSITIPVRAAVPSLISYDLTLGGIQRNRPFFIHTMGLSENRDENLRGVVHFNGESLPSGLYPVSIRVSSHYGESTISSRIQDQVMIVNPTDAPFGKGWGLSGFSRMILLPDNQVLLTEDDGSTRLFIEAQNLERTAYFPFDDRTSPTLDVVGSVPGAVNGPQFVTTDLAPLKGNRSAILFDGEEDQVVVEHHPAVSFAPDEEMSISFWFKANSFRERMYLLGKEESCCFTGINYQFARDGRLLHFRSDGGIVTTGQDVRVNVLTHMAVTYQPGGALKIFIDGEEVANAPGYRLLGANTAPLIMGSSGSCSQHFPGTLDELQFFRRALSAEEIQILAARVEPPNGLLRSPNGDSSVVIKNEDGTILRTLRDGSMSLYDESGLLLQQQDLNGNTTRYEYDDQSRLIRIIDPLKLITHLTYQGAFLSMVQDPFSRITRFHHDDQGNLSEVIFPDQSGWSYTYDSRNLLVSETNPNSFVTTHTYDFLGRAVAAQFQDGSIRQTSGTQAFGAIDATSNLGTRLNPAPYIRPEQVIGRYVDELNRTTTYRVGPLGALTEQRDPSGLLTTFEYDSAGNTVLMTFPSGESYRGTYDRSGNLTSRTDLILNATTRLDYDTQSNQVTTYTQPLGNAFEFSFDPMGNLLEAKTPLGQIRSATYNDQGLIQTRIDPNGLGSAFEYDPRGNRLWITQAGGSDSREYKTTNTPTGYVQTQKDSLDRSITFEHDDFGRILTETPINQEPTRYSYDPTGNLLSVTPPTRPPHEFAYNLHNLLTHYTAPPLADEPVTTTWEYNAARQLTRKTLPGGKTHTLKYDDAGRLSESSTSQSTNHYTYDPNKGLLTAIESSNSTGLQFQYRGGNLSRLTQTGPAPGVVQFEYDNNDRIQTLRLNQTPIVFHEFNADNLLTQVGRLSLTRNPTNGLVIATTLDAISTSHELNSFQEPILLTASSNNQPFWSLEYTRDAMGQIIEKTEVFLNSTLQETYSYDPQGRLLEITQNGAPIATYTYDSNGNRLTETTPSEQTTYLYDAQDRLTQFGDVSLTYTPDGSLLTRQTLSQSPTTYHYDALGNLLQVTLPDQTDIQYLVDGLNRRIAKKTNGIITRGFVYSSQLQIIAELDGNGNVISRFTYADQSNSPDFMVREGVTYRILKDSLGSPRIIIDASSGDIAQRINYDAWGRVLLDTNPGFQPFGFAGGLYDPDTQLVRFGFRDYDPELGRWTTKDPRLFDGGQSNLYTYLGNDPLNGTDPTGEIFFLVIPAAVFWGGTIGAAATAVVLGALAIGTNADIPSTPTGVAATVCAGGVLGAGIGAGAAYLGGSGAVGSSKVPFDTVIVRGSGHIYTRGASGFYP